MAGIGTYTVYIVSSLNGRSEQWACSCFGRQAKRSLFFGLSSYKVVARL